jgi:hypothetical protein
MKKMVCAAAVASLVLTTTAAHAQLDHMLCYKIGSDTFKFATTTAVDMVASLQPEFTQKGCRLDKPVAFCVPAGKKNVTPASANVNPNIGGAPLRNDYICYSAKCPNQVTPASKVVTDQFGTHTQEHYMPATVCVPAVKDPVECSAGTATGAAMCNGVCPDPTEQCVFDNKTKRCSCETVQRCGGKPNSAGLCGGPCPTGEVCLPEMVAGTSNVECTCQTPPPPPCGMESTGTCGGTCPNPADKCSLDAAGRCTCQPVGQLCAADANGVCGGVCELPGQQCHPDATGACTCVTPCGRNPLTGQCDGECATSTDVCALGRAGCECVPPSDLPCGTVSGTCGGVCPPGETCGTDSTGACNCQSPSPCSLDATGQQCGGVCPAGTTCTLITTATGLGCGCLNSPAP